MVAGALCNYAELIDTIFTDVEDPHCVVLSSPNASGKNLTESNRA
jgi:hypothetical protein